MLLRRNSEVFAATAGIQGGAFDSRCLRVEDCRSFGSEELQLSETGGGSSIRKQACRSI